MMGRNYYILILKTAFILTSAARLTAAYGQYAPDNMSDYCSSPNNYSNQYCDNNNNNYSNQPYPSYQPYHNYYPYLPGTAFIQNRNRYEGNGSFEQRYPETNMTHRGDGITPEEYSDHH